MLLVVECGNMRVIRDEDNVGVLEGALLAIFVQHLVNDRVGNPLEIRDLRGERILSDVCEDINSGKVNYLQIWYTVVFNGLYQFFRGATVNSSAEGLLGIAASESSAY